MPEVRLISTRTTLRGVEPSIDIFTEYEGEGPPIIEAFIADVDLLRNSTPVTQGFMGVTVDEDRIDAPSFSIDPNTGMLTVIALNSSAYSMDEDSGQLIYTFLDA